MELNDETKKLLASLQNAKPEDFDSEAKMKSNPDMYIENLIGNLRKNKWAFEYAKRKKLTGDELNKHLDGYNRERERFIDLLKRLGHNYIKGEEDDPKYDRWESL